MNTVAVRFRQHWFSQESDGWHYAIFRILWSQFHLTFAIYIFCWTYRERELPTLAYPGFLSVFSQIPTQIILGLAVLHCSIAACILVGWRTRLMQIAVCLSTIPLVFHSVSHYQNHYIFYALVTLYVSLMPTERFFSLDAHHMKRTMSSHAYAAWKNTHVTLFPQRLIQLQLSFLYLFAALNKLEPTWFARWSTTPEFSTLTTRPFIAELWMQLVDAGIAWIPLAVTIGILFILSVGIHYANKYPFIALVGILMHLSFHYVLPIMEFTAMCSSILLLSLFPVRSKIIEECKRVLR